MSKEDDINDFASQSSNQSIEKKPEMSYTYVQPRFPGEFLDSIPDFSGASSGLTFDEFYYRIQLIADHEQWTEDDILLVLRLKLTDAAARFVRDNPKLKDEKKLEIVMKALRERFESPEFLHTNLRQLLQSYQRPSESVREYASRLEIASYKTISPGLVKNEVANQSRLDVLTSVFIDGLKPSIRRHILPQNHKTFESARQHAISEEEVWMKQHPDDPAENMRVVTVPSQSNNELVQLIKAQQDTIKSLSDSMAALQVQVQEVVRTTQNNEVHRQQNQNKQIGPRCFYCNRLGHVSRNCQALLRDNQRQGAHRYTPNDNQRQGAHGYTPPPQNTGNNPFATYAGYAYHFQNKKN